MTESQNGFPRLIKQLPKTFTVLDVGAGGLQGENTTNYLIEHFDAKNILGVCRADVETQRFIATREANKMFTIPIISDDFYQIKFDGQFDLVVLDMNIGNNLEKDWSDEGLERMRSLVKDGGYLINYIMTTDQYGDPEKTPEFIRKYWWQWWNTGNLTMRAIGEKLRQLDGWELFDYEQEPRRDYILWTMLKKTNGS